MPQVNEFSWEMITLTFLFAMIILFSLLSLNLNLQFFKTNSHLPMKNFFFFI